MLQLVTYNEIVISNTKRCFMKKIILSSLYAVLLSGTIIASDAPANVPKFSDEVIPMLTLSATLRLGSDRWKKGIQKNGATERTQLEIEHENTYKWYKPSFNRYVEPVAQFNLQNQDGIVTVHTDFAKDIIQAPYAKDRCGMALFGSANRKPEHVTDFNEHTKCAYTWMSLYTKKDDGQFIHVGTRMRGTCDTTMQSERLQGALAKALDCMNKNDMASLYK